MTSRGHQGMSLYARYSFELKHINYQVADPNLSSFAPFFILVFHLQRWKSPKNEWRQQPWDVQTIPTIVRLRDVSAFRFRPSR